jgi:hypothetical protein
MREGERARIHVPAALGYGSSPQGSKVICSLHSFSFALIYCHTLKIGLPNAVHSRTFQGERGTFRATATCCLTFKYCTEQASQSQSLLTYNGFCSTQQHEVMVKSTWKLLIVQSFRLAISFSSSSNASNPLFLPRRNSARCHVMRIHADSMADRMRFRRSFKAAIEFTTWDTTRRPLRGI